MTPLQKDYLVFCLKSIPNILSDNDQLQKAVLGLTGGNILDQRYYYYSKVTDSKSWLPGELLHLSAAVFEANAKYFEGRTLIDYEELQGISEAKNLLMDRYLKEITENTHPFTRLESVQSNIERVLREIESEFPTEPTYSWSDYSGAFFAVAAAAAAACVVSLMLPEPAERRPE